jgi:hypothetical protein
MNQNGTKTSLEVLSWILIVGECIVAYVLQNKTIKHHYLIRN